MNEQQLAILAEKFGVTIEHLWNVLLVQANVEIICNVFGLMLVIGFLVGFYFVWKRMMKSEDIDTEAKTGISILVGITEFFFSIIIICVLGDLVTLYFNPEYWALSQILNK